MGRLIAVTSGKGGAGKSTVSAGLGVILARLGKSVLIIDTDEGLRCLDIMLGLEERLVFDLSDVLEGTKELSDAVLNIDGLENAFLLAAPDEKGKIDRVGLGSLVMKAVDDYDFVILDCPAGVNTMFCQCLPAFCEVITVVTPDAVSIRDAMSVAMEFEASGLDNNRMIINKFDLKTMAKSEDNIDDIIDKTGIRLLGIVPFDEKIRNFFKRGRIFEGGRSADALSRIALRILGENIPLKRLEKL